METCIPLYREDIAGGNKLVSCREPAKVKGTIAFPIRQFGEYALTGKPCSHN